MAIYTSSTTITRPADTIAYTANDAWSNATAAATNTFGGFTLSGLVLANGGSGTITDAVFSTSALTALQGELWLFDQAVPAILDNVAFDVSDANMLNFVGVIPFNCTDVNSSNAASWVTDVNCGFTCVGGTSLRFLIKVMNAPTPASAEVLSVRVKVVS